MNMSSVPSIKKLDETVINRIAAGEVIQRPANALKELLENSLDAKSTKIQVTVKQGGLKFLQIQDNGVGIRKEDLGIVCERFTTSKLSSFEDLSSISTFGFRGEALASISHVAHLTIVTKVADSPVGYKACYEDSKLKQPPKPFAATQGTQITVEDLFYNVSTRRKALKSPTEEHMKVVEVVSKYAVHNSHVGFSLKKQHEKSSDIKTPGEATKTDVIRTIYGNAVANELLEVTTNNDTLKFKLSGLITNVNYSNKKLIFLLFINNRLVDSSGLRKIIEQTYSNYLPKNSHPLIYLSIDLDPQNVDVNVHPTKHEVHFLHEEAIIDKIRLALENVLAGSNNSRVVYTQAKLPTSFSTSIELESDSSVENTTGKKQYAHKTVRTDSTEQKLDKFFHKSLIVNESKENDETHNSEEDKIEISSPVIPTHRPTKLRSILQLRADVENNVHTGLQSVMKNFTVVGFIDPSECLLQHDTKLYLCNTEKLLEELFYQVMLFNFANFGVIRFSTPLAIKMLVSCYFDTEGSNWNETDGSQEEIATSIVELLVEKAAMLEDYFAIEVDAAGNLCTMPLVIEKYMPDTALLPDFIVRVCTDVDWNLEKDCLDGICKELAKFYSKVPTKDKDDSGNFVDVDWKWITEHALLPSIKSTLITPKKFAQDGTVLQIANLPDLYKVFERC